MKKRSGNVLVEYVKNLVRPSSTLCYWCSSAFHDSAQCPTRPTTALFVDNMAKYNSQTAFLNDPKALVRKAKD